MKRKILLGILALVVIGGFIGYRMYSMKNDDLVSQKPDAVTTAVQLIAAFDKDSAAARKQFFEKVVEVSGTVTGVDSAGSISLGGSEGSQSNVVVSLDARYAKDYQKVKTGETAVLQGKCIDYTIGEEMLGVSLGTTVKLNFGGLKNKK